MTADETDILLVADNALDVNLALDSLNRNRLASRIRVAHDGNEALDFIFCRGLFAGRKVMARPLLVLLDFGLTGISALQVLREIKGDARTAKIAVVILISGESDLDLQTAIKFRADAFMVKPFTFEKLFPIARRLDLLFLLLRRETSARS